MRTIALEEHYATPAFMAGPGGSITAMASATGHAEIVEEAAHPVEPICDLGGRRVAAVDAAGIGLHVLALSPPGAGRRRRAGADSRHHRNPPRHPHQIRI